MASFLDGPAKDRSLSLRTCPHYLRVVVDERGKIDALDQVEDVPESEEQIEVYVIVNGTWGVVFVRPGGRFEYGEYRHMAGLDPDLLLSFGDRERWIAWLREHGDAEAEARGLDPWPGSEKML